MGTAFAAIDIVLLEKNYHPALQEEVFFTTRQKTCPGVRRGAKGASAAGQGKIFED